MEYLWCQSVQCTGYFCVTAREIATSRDQAAGSDAGLPQRHWYHWLTSLCWYIRRAAAVLYTCESFVAREADAQFLGQVDVWCWFTPTTPNFWAEMSTQEHSVMEVIPVVVPVYYCYMSTCDLLKNKKVNRMTWRVRSDVTDIAAY